MFWDWEYEHRDVTKWPKPNQMDNNSNHSFQRRIGDAVKLVDTPERKFQIHTSAEPIGRPISTLVVRPSDRIRRRLVGHLQNTQYYYFLPRQWESEREWNFQGRLIDCWRRFNVPDGDRSRSDAKSPRRRCLPWSSTALRGGGQSIIQNRLKNPSKRNVAKYLRRENVKVDKWKVKTLRHIK